MADEAAFPSMSNKLVVIDAGFSLCSGRCGGEQRLRASGSGGALEARKASTAGVPKRRREVRSFLRRLNKPPLATIQSPDGDVIDCVHISKQPAFDHPLLKNHTIQMRPSCHPGGMYHESHITHHPINQTWHLNGKCPENTIPIRRIKEEDVLRASSMTRYGTKRTGSIPNNNSINDPETPNVLRGHQHAVASAQVDKCHGTKISINLWQPTISRANAFSLTQLWIIGGSYSGNDLNTIEARWQVYPHFYSDNNPRLFIYWTSDAYKKQQDVTTYYAQGLSKQTIRSPLVAASPQSSPPMVAHNMTSTF
ncbi:hypothetical protein ACQ4PT_031493 [Festuca glaucescens]